MADDESTIAGQCGQAKQSLTTLLTYLTESQSQKETEPTSKPLLDAAPVEDVLDRFLLWAGNLGAMRAPISRLSLDYRLADAPEVKELICQYLADLREAVDDLAEIVQGVSSNHDIMAGDDEEEGPSDEAAMLFEIVTESVKALFHVGILVRKAGADDRFRRAQKTARSAFPESFDINHATAKYPKLRKGADGLLGPRVGSAISKRRQFIKYCRDHRYRLGREEAEGLEDAEPAAGPTPTEMLSSKASTFHPEMVPQSVLLSTMLEDDKEEDDVASLISTATVTDPSSQLELPKLSDLSTDGHPFECPICFSLQSFQKERAWRNHAFRDLRAYVCTVGGTECDSELFGDYNSWFDHELRQHRAQYACSLCNDGKLVSEADLKAHIGANHGGFGSEQLHQLLDASRQMPAKIRAADCPFCDTWEEKLRERHDPNTAAAQDDSREIFVSLNRFKRHVAMHQEDLAVFAMPRAAENTGVSGRGSNDSHSNTSGSVAAWSVDVEPESQEPDLDGDRDRDGEAPPLQDSYEPGYPLSAEEVEFLNRKFDEHATLYTDSDGTTEVREMAQLDATASDQESDNRPPIPPQAAPDYRPGNTDQTSEDIPPIPRLALQQNQLGGVPAPPPGESGTAPDQPPPPPPDWLANALADLLKEYPTDSFEAFMRYCAINTDTNAFVSLPLPDHQAGASIPPNIVFAWIPRIRCHDCPGRAYTAGPEMTVQNFEAHLKNRVHRERVQARLREGEASQPLGLGAAELARLHYQFHERLSPRIQKFIAGGPSDHKEWEGQHDSLLVETDSVLRKLHALKARGFHPASQVEANWVALWESMETNVRIKLKRLESLEFDGYRGVEETGETAPVPPGTSTRSENVEDQAEATGQEHNAVPNLPVKDASSIRKAAAARGAKEDESELEAPQDAATGERLSHTTVLDWMIRTAKDRYSAAGPDEYGFQNRTDRPSAIPAAAQASEQAEEDEIMSEASQDAATDEPVHHTGQTIDSLLREVGGNKGRVVDLDEYGSNTETGRLSPTSPPPQKKTANMCLTCRLRRVRCDRRPGGCANCERSGRDCSYDEDVQTGAKTESDDLASDPRFFRDAATSEAHLQTLSRTPSIALALARASASGQAEDDEPKLHAPDDAATDSLEGRLKRLEAVVEGLGTSNDAATPEKHLQTGVTMASDASASAVTQASRHAGGHEPELQVPDDAATGSLESRLNRLEASVMNSMNDHDASTPKESLHGLSRSFSMPQLDTNASGEAGDDKPKPQVPDNTATGEREHGTEELEARAHDPGFSRDAATPEAFSQNLAATQPVASVAARAMQVAANAQAELRGLDDRGPEYSIFVGDLGPEVNEFVLVSLFQSRFPSCKSAKVMIDAVTGQSRGYGFVRFSDESDQQRALVEMQGVYCGNRPMRLSTATPTRPLSGVRRIYPSAAEGDEDAAMGSNTQQFHHRRRYPSPVEGDNDAATGEGEHEPKNLDEPGRDTGSERNPIQPPDAYLDFVNQLSATSAAPQVLGQDANDESGTTATQASGQAGNDESKTSMADNIAAHERVHHINNELKEIPTGVYGNKADYDDYLNRLQAAATFEDLVAVQFVRQAENNRPKLQVPDDAATGQGVHQTRDPGESVQDTGGKKAAIDSEEHFQTGATTSDASAAAQTTEPAGEDGHKTHLTAEEDVSRNRRVTARLRKKKKV